MCSKLYHVLTKLWFFRVLSQVEIQSFATMKLENEHVRGVQTSPRKSYNPFDSDDDNTDAYAKCTVNGYDIKSFETTADSLTFHLESGYLSWEEATLEHSQMLSNPISVDAISDEVIYRKDTELFTDKTVTECEPPEAVFGYKENGFHSVKDIGIDEGLPNHEKVWIKNQENHEHRGLSANADLQLKSVRSRPINGDEVFPSSQPQSVESVKGNGLEHEVLEKPYSDDQCKTDLLKVDELEHENEESVEENRLEHDVLEMPYSDDRCKSDLLKLDELEHDISNIERESKSNLQGTDLVKSVGVGNVDNDSNLNGNDEKNYHKVEKTGNEVYEEQYFNDIPFKDSGKCSENLSTEHEIEMKIESNEYQSKEVASTQPVELGASQELVSGSVTNTVTYSSKEDSGSIILDLNADSKASTKENEEIPDKEEAVEKPPQTQTMSRDNGGASAQSVRVSGTDRRVHGETSFSAAMPLHASITYMGPQSHIGSTSLRSESSTGSTRSFAFPVLQAEWNTSPVRMAKADQRHFHKPRGWVHSLICCKF